MAGRVAPYVDNTGLVFAYDQSNTVRSYLGEPTQNLLSYTTEFNSWTKTRNSGTTPTVTSDTSPNPLGLSNAPMADKLYIPDDGTYPRVEQTFTPSSTNQHTMSVWIRSLSGNCDCFLGIFRTSPWSLPGHTVVSVTSEWQRFSFTMTPLDTTTHLAYIGSHDAPAQKGNTLELWGAMIEENAHKTSYTAGTRSATQGLKDLTGNSTIDLTNVSFDSNAQMTFDGTSDYVTVPHNTLHSFTGDFSIEIVFRPTGNTANCLIQKGSGNDYFQEYWVLCDTRGSNTSFELIMGQVGNTSANYNVRANNAVLGQYHHIVTGVQGSTGFMYVNGELIDTGAVTDRIQSTSDIRIGERVDGFADSLGDQPLTKIYNRALSASEVKSNFNAIKGRYGI